jgi:uncharacterized membrane protein
VLAAIVLALGAAAGYGVSDFLGGVSSARLRVAPTALIGYALATATAAVALLATGASWSPAAVAWGAAAGLFAIIGTLLVYGALVAGPVSIGIAIVGTLESAVPVLVTVLLGVRMPGLVWLAIVLAVAGGALVPLRFGAGERMTPRAALLAVTGGLFFGGSVVALDEAPPDAGLIPAVFTGGVGFALMLALLGAARVAAPVGRLLRLFDGGTDAARETLPPRSPLRRLAPALAAGLLLGAANTLLVLALRAGPLAVVSVLADLYPVATGVLAWFVLHERLAPLQLLGVALAIAASALFALA